MTHTSTPRAVGAALALLVGSAAGLSAQTTPATPDSSRAGIPGGTTGSAAGTATGSANGTVSGSASGAAAMPGMNMQGNVRTSAPSTTMQNNTPGASNGAAAPMAMPMQDSTPRMRGTTARRRRMANDPVRKDVSGMSVQKDVAPAPAPEPAPEPAPLPPPPPAPEPVPAPLPPPPPAPDSVVTTTTTTTTVIPATQERKLGNGFYVGLQGGANFPQNNLRDSYRTGFNGGIQLGYDPKSSPIGLRVNALYNRFRGDNNSSVALQPNRGSDAETYSAFADATLRLPFGKFLGSTSGFYLVGGPGVTLFRNYRDFQNQTGVTVGDATVNNTGKNNVTRFSLNGGAGLEYGIGNVSLFTEARYVRVFTQGHDTDYLPLNFGLRFHGR